MMQTLPLSGVFYSTSFVFFFQAEDGIRDGHVTGVQTCALPISCPCPIELCEVVHAPHAPSSSAKLLFWTRISTTSQSRSEERRVGKECRSRWSAYHAKKKTMNLGDMPDVKADVDTRVITTVRQC